MAVILWGLYWLGAVVTTAVGIHDAFVQGIGSITGGFMIHLALSLQSLLGLMLLTVQARTAGQERNRSLDVPMVVQNSTGRSSGASGWGCIESPSGWPSCPESPR